MSGETELTSYCFLSSVTIDHSGVWLKVLMSIPPISLASVVRMPTFLRPLFDTTRIERVSSYSTGRPRSKNGITTSSTPDVNATPRKTSDCICLPCSSENTRRGSIPNRFSASRASVENSSVGTRFKRILPPLRASYSLSSPSRSALIST